MFENIGKKIKILAKVICYFGILGFVIAAIVLFVMSSDMMYGGETLVGIGFTLLILGPLFSWISSFFMYGFGELIDNSNIIKKNLAKNPVISNVTYKENPKAEKIDLIKDTKSYKTEVTIKGKEFFEVKLPELVSTPAKANTKRCLACSRLVPDEQNTCVCGSVEFDMFNT